MDILYPNLLDVASLRSVFVNQLSILYYAKAHLTDNLPDFIEHSTYKILKLALAEDLEDTQTQMVCINSMFRMLNETAITDNCLGITALVNEAFNQINYNKDNSFEIDMSIIFYMGVMENMQVGASKMLKLIAKKPAYKQYAQLVTESLDIASDNARLFHCIADEYIQIGVN
jgi:ferritin-like metal-binding protein YciE